MATGLGLCCLGAGYGTAKCGLGVMTMGVMRPDLALKGLTAVLMAGIVGMYGFIMCFLMMANFSPEAYSLYQGCMQLAGGVAVGLSGLAAGLAIGIVGDAGTRAMAHQPRLFISMCLVLVFAEILGIYGFIVGLILNTKAAGPAIC